MADGKQKKRKLPECFVGEDKRDSRSEKRGAKLGVRGGEREKKSNVSSDKTARGGLD